MPTATPFNNLITFSRGSNATVTGSNGLIQWAPNNLLTFSEQFDNAAWGKSLITITANSSEAPDGTITADRIVSAGGAFPQISQAATLLAGQAYTFSIWVRSDGTAQIQQTILLEGQLTNFTPTSTWQRISVTVPSSAGGSRSAVIATNNGSAPASSFLVWGAQLELGSTATTYNPTTVKNLLGFSGAFDNAAWNKVSSSIVTGAQANPVNGLFNAQKLMEGTDAAGKQVTQGVATTANPFTFSSYVKAAGRNWAVLAITDSGSVVRRGFFNLATGAVGTTDAGITASITSVGSGWYRCAVTIAASLAGTTTCRIYLSNDGVNTSYTGDGNSGVYIYGAQLSDSASLDPYVPTPGAAPSSTAFYGPRFDFDPVTLQPRGLLVEEQRTNLATYSDDWSNAIWSKAASNCAITSNATVSPDGTTNADKLIPLAGATDGRTNQAITGSAGTTYTLSVYGKQAEFTNCRLYADDGGSNLASVSYNLATGAIFTAAVAAGTWTSVSTTITPVGNGWWRMTLTWTATGAAPTRIAYWCRDTGNGTSGIFLYGAQLEAGAFATSYIPTVASTVTRSADVATVTGQNFGQWYGQPEGTFVVGVTYLNALNTAWVSTAHSGTAASTNDYIALVKNSAAINRQAITAAGVAQGNIEFAGAVAGTNYLLGGAYKLNDAAFTVNGAAPGTDTTVTLPTPNALAIGNLFNQYLNGHIRSINYVPARAADFQLQALST